MNSARYSMPTEHGPVKLTKAPDARWYVACDGQPTRLVDVDDLPLLLEATA